MDQTTTAATTLIPQADPGAGYRAQRDEIDAAVARALGSGWYILGKEGEAFEREFAAWLGTARAVGCANGTDALALILRGLGIGEGATVATVSHTAVATVAAIEMVGAVPLLLDIDPDTYTMDPDELAGGAGRPAAGPAADPRRHRRAPLRPGLRPRPDARRLRARRRRADRGLRAGARRRAARAEARHDRARGRLQPLPHQEPRRARRRRRAGDRRFRAGRPHRRHPPVRLARALHLLPGRREQPAGRGAGGHPARAPAAARRRQRPPARDRRFL